MKKNNISLLFGVPGIVLQIGSGCLSGVIEAGFDLSPEVATLVFFAGLLLGTALLMVGLAYYAQAKGQSAVWCLMGFLGIIGLIVLATLPDRHGHGRRVRKLNNRIADPPEQNALEFRCHQCDYQLNGSTGAACPECGRPFNPDDLRTVHVVGVDPPKAPWMGRWSLICGIIGIVLTPLFLCGPILGVVGVVFGHVARGAIKKSALPGGGVALAGVITSYLAIGLSIAFFLLAFILPAVVSSL